jgi:hypothetical protein
MRLPWFSLTWFAILPPRAGLDDFRDGHDLGLLGNGEAEHHVHHLVDHGV